MLTGIYQSAGLLLIIGVFYIKDFFSIARYDQERSAEGSGRSWDYTIMLLTAAVLMIVQPVLLPGLGVTIEARWALIIQAVGLLIALGGLGLNWWSRDSLKQFYAERVELQPEHQIITNGPYATIRHPVFTSFFMIVIGCFLINPAVPTLLIMIYAFWDFSGAARQEEVLLSENLPGYADYMTHTSAFFPIPGQGRGRK
ncbi:MAG: isoprenylcysteine carboxylmethyltransferase family protein [Chloroflexi bacterium]|nr:isoprenylcysteine carboxylmethyltransferase family protein [Chloroflexota bacterium]